MNYLKSGITACIILLCTSTQAAFDTPSKATKQEDLRPTPKLYPLTLFTPPTLWSKINANKRLFGSIAIGCSTILARFLLSNCSMETTQPWRSFSKRYTDQYKSLPLVPIASLFYLSYWLNKVEDASGSAGKKSPPSPLERYLPTAKTLSKLSLLLGSSFFGLWALDLFNHGFASKPALKEGEKGGFTALHQAVIMADEKLCTDLIKSGADVNAKDSSGYSPLHIAAEKGLTSTCTELITHGADMYAKTREGKTPLQIAEENGFSGAFAEAHRRNTKLTDALFELIKKRAPLNEIQSIIEKGAHIHAKKGSYGWEASTLHVAAASDLPEVCELLLNKGANINALGRMGRGTPLMAAALRGNVASTKLLIARGADIHFADEFGYGPLKAALYGNHDTICTMLLRNMLRQELIAEEPIDLRKNRLKTGHLVLQRLINQGRMHKNLIPMVMDRDPMLKRDLAAILYSNYLNPLKTGALYGEIDVSLKDKIRACIPQSVFANIKTTMRGALRWCKDARFESLLDPDTLESNFSSIFF